MIKTLRYSLLSLLVLICGSAFAEEKEIVFTNETVTSTSDGFTLAVSPFNFSAVKNTGSSKPTQPTAKDLRIYAKGTFSISGAVSMTKVVFTVSSQGKKRWAELTPSTGSISHDVDNGIITWTSEEGVATVDLTVGDNAVYGTDGNTKAGQFCIDAATITYTIDESSVSAPTISGTTPSLNDIEVTISADEGCDIYYTTDGSDPSTSSTKYTAPFNLTASATVKAIAVKDGKESAVAEKAFEKIEPTEATIAGLNEKTEDLAWVKLKFNDAVVTYVDGDKIYLREGEKALMLYGIDFSTHAVNTIEAGDVFSGELICDYDNYYGIHEVKANVLTDVDDVFVTQLVVGGTAPAPTVASLSDLIDLKHICDYVMVQGTIVADGTNYYVQDAGSNKVQLYKGLDVSNYAGDGKTYYITAVFNNIYKSAPELQPIAVSENDPTAVEGIKADASSNGTIYNLAGQQRSKLAKGINIVNGKKVIK